MENKYSKEKTNIISIVATKSKMGKTTLIENLIKEFVRKGYRVGVLIHDTHNFDIDEEGKDSYRFSQAGAKEVINSSSKKIAYIKSQEKEEKIENLIDLFRKVDLIFIEGFKNNNYPKIEVHRKEKDNDFLFNNNIHNRETFLALATDEKVSGILNLDLDNTQQIVEFIELYIKSNSLKYVKEKQQLVTYQYEKTFKVPISKVEGYDKICIEEDIIGEYPLTFIHNNAYSNTFLCTPERLKELVVGFLATKNVIQNKEDILSLIIDEDSRIAYANTLFKKEAEDKNILFLNSLDYVKCKPVEDKNSIINVEDIYKLMSRNLTYSTLFRNTGGAHCVAIFDKDKEIIICEDVARHNAMDKAIGYCILEGIDLKDKAIFVSGRISLEMILKAAHIQIPIVISKSAPTNLSVELAQKLNITLVGFVRGERMNIYANPQRIMLDKR